MCAFPGRRELTLDFPEHVALTDARKTTLSQSIDVFTTMLCLSHAHLSCSNPASPATPVTWCGPPQPPSPPVPHSLPLTFSVHILLWLAEVKDCVHLAVLLFTLWYGLKKQKGEQFVVGAGGVFDMQLMQCFWRKGELWDVVNEIGDVDVANHYAVFAAFVECGADGRGENSSFYLIQEVQQLQSCLA